MAEGERLAKRVAALVACSRSDAEALIESGHVRVDGVVVDTPQHRVTHERIEVEPGAQPAPVQPVTLLMHKPAGMTGDDALAAMTPENFFTAAPHAGGPRAIRRHFTHQTQLLPLPREASGLVVFSQVRGVIRRLTEEAATTEQELIVQVEGSIAEGGLQRLSQGLRYEGRSLPRIKVSWQNETRLRFALQDIRPDVVPWMCEQVGLRVAAMKRIRIGRLPMAGLPEGQWRYLGLGERF